MSNREIIKTTGVVNRIIPFSCVDGPGSRITMFFQGCNMSCLNCHNAYTKSFCNHCGDCIPSCPSSALSLNPENKIQWNRDLCTDCDTCIDICPISASPKTLQLSAQDLIAQIRTQLPFINGITLSGGEVTVQLPFLIEFLTLLKQQQDLSALTCLLDSNGTLSVSSWEKLLPLIDGVMVDLKCWQAENHKRLTGITLSKVKKSIQFLAEKGKLAEVRLLPIPGQTDYQTDMTSLVEFLNQMPPNTTIRINAYHPHNSTLDKNHYPAVKQEYIEQFAQELSDLGCRAVITPAVYLSI